MVTELVALLPSLHNGATTTNPPLTDRPTPLLPRDCLPAPLCAPFPVRAFHSLSLALSLSLVIDTMKVRVLYNPFCPSSSTNNVVYVPLAVLSRPIRTCHGGVSLCKAADKRALCGRKRTGG